MSNSEQTFPAVTTPETDATTAKLPYNAPEFTDLGSVEQITLGGFTTAPENFGGVNGSV